MTPTLHASGTKTPARGTFTVTIASPGVFTFTGHGLGAGDKVTFSTTGALPTGLTAGTTYFVIATGLTANTFQVSATEGGSAVNTSGTQSGTHSLVSEVTLVDIAVAGTFQGGFDLSNLASGDTEELRVYKIFKAGGTRRQVYFDRYSDAQDDSSDAKSKGKVWVAVSNALTDAGSLRFTLKQTAGTARSVDWEVLKF